MRSFTARRSGASATQQWALSRAWWITLCADNRTWPVTRMGFAGFPWRAAVWRAVTFLVLWLILVGGRDPADRPAGIIAIVAATWASLRLLPPRGARLAPVALARLAFRFFRQSIVAGIDVAWRALDPRLPLRPGFVAYRARLPAGPALNAFCALTSLDQAPSPPDPMTAVRSSSIAWMSSNRSRRCLPKMSDFWRKPLESGTMADFLPLVVVLRPGDGGTRPASYPARPGSRGPHDGGATSRHRRHRGAGADGRGVRSDGAGDVALVLALLAAFASVAFVIGGSRANTRRRVPAERA